MGANHRQDLCVLMFVITPTITNLETTVNLLMECKVEDCKPFSIVVLGEIMNYVTGLFRDKESAENAYRLASQTGYSDNEINVVMSEDTKEKYYGKGTTLETEVGSKVAEGAAIGGAVGGAVGATLAAIAAIGSTLAFPGLGIIVAGPLAAAIAGAGAGGVTAGLVGALIGWGIPEDRLKEYEQEVKDGGVLIGVNPRNDADRVRFENNWNAPQHLSNI